jgi:cytochrome c biogenesis protein CcmG/thiol:disulfide interchange protein DsbE
MAPLAVAAVVAIGLTATFTMCGGSGGSGSTATLPASPTALPQVDTADFRTILASLKGRPVVVNVWASWCGPCIREAPGLAQLARTYGGRVRFLGIDSQDLTIAAARRFIVKYGWTYPSLFDPDGALERALGYIGQPVTVVYGADGSKQKVFAGPVETEALRTEIERALATPPTGSP